MTPEERTLIMHLVVTPGRDRMEPEEFLNNFGHDDGKKLGLELLRDAIVRSDPTDVELALVVCFAFGFEENHIAPLLELATADWHERHEDVAAALGQIATPDSVEVLSHLAVWVPNYLEYDASRALAVKAIWALGSIGDAAAERVLRFLSTSEDCRGAKRYLATRKIDRLVDGLNTVVLFPS